MWDSPLSTRWAFDRQMTLLCHVFLQLLSFSALFLLFLENCVRENDRKRKKERKKERKRERKKETKIVYISLLLWFLIQSWSSGLEKCCCKVSSFALILWKRILAALGARKSNEFINKDASNNSMPFIKHISVSKVRLSSRVKAISNTQKITSEKYHLGCVTWKLSNMALSSVKWNRAWCDE